MVQNKLIVLNTGAFDGINSTEKLNVSQYGNLEILFSRLTWRQKTMPNMASGYPASE